MAATMPWGEVVDVTMALGFEVNKFTLDDPVLGLLDGEGVLDGTLLGLSVVDYVQEVRINRGRSNQQAAFTASTCDVVLNNNDRRFDPINEDSPYWNPDTDTSGVQPRRAVRIESDGELLFVGAITAVNVDYDGTLSTCTIEAADDFVLLGNQYLQTALTPPVEVSGTRIASILDLAAVDYPADQRNIATGGKDVQALTIDANTNVLDYLQDVATADQALLFMSRDGTLTYSDPLETVWFDDYNVTLVDASQPVVAGVVRYTAIKTITDQTFLYNKVIASKAGGADTVEDDAASQTQYGIATLSLSGLLLENQADVDTLASTLLARYKDPIYRFDDLQLSVNAMTSNGRTITSQLELGDTVQVERTFTTGTPLSVDAYYQVERLQRTITPMAHTLQVGLGDLKTLVYPWTLDDPDLSKLDAFNAVT